MKKILVMTFVLVFGFVFVSPAQVRKIPAAVTNAFSEKYQEAKNVEWKDRLSWFSVIFEMDEVQYEARFNKKGEWQSTEQEIQMDDLSDKVKDGFEKSKYSDWEVRGVYQIEVPDDKMQFRIRVAKSDIQQKNLLFGENGKLLKDNLTL